MAHRLEADREQCGRDLLAGRDQHVGLARAWRFAEFGCELEQTIGFAGHRGHDHDDPIAAVARTDHAIGDRLDSFDRADRGSAVFLNY